MSESGLREWVASVESLLQSSYVLSKKTIASLLLQEDGEIEKIVRAREGKNFDKIALVVQRAREKSGIPLNYLIAMEQQKKADIILEGIIALKTTRRTPFREVLSRLAIHPASGSLLFFLTLYFGFYIFVGRFGAGTLVDFMEKVVFEEYINPFAVWFFTYFIPWPILQDLFIGEYGIVTMAIRYAAAIVLPIVFVFFLVFSAVEDSGYLPRIAMLIDRVFKYIGLSGRAVIPMILGFGCSTMATIVTRTLSTKKERIISTLLLALAIPCSAQLGVIMAFLQGNALSMLIWVGVVSSIFLLVGFLSSKILPGEKPVFYMEIPPLRVPRASDILLKTCSRMVWYIKELFPIFILGSVLIWLGQILGAFDFLIEKAKTPLYFMGLPEEAAPALIFGFFRRDYGIAGLYDLNKAGLLSGVQALVSSIALTLYLPCVAQLMVNIKERGVKTGIFISLFVLFSSFVTASFINAILSILGVVL